MQLEIFEKDYPEFKPSECDLFQQYIWAFYKKNKRDFAWRCDITPYRIVVSEIMLQQTQTERVKKKFVEFISALPDFEALAQASTAQVITLWQGLGYNRRALALHKIAQAVVREFGGVVPADPQILKTLPGLGDATAASICAFSYNMPTVFIETNIRSVFLYSFFRNQSDVSDKQIFPLIEQTLDRHNPREWYYALMDYGVALKKRFKNPSRKSRHHTRQSKFEGSERQIRGMILRRLTTHSCCSFDQLCESIDRDPKRIARSLEALIAEGFVEEFYEFYRLKR